MKQFEFSSRAQMVLIGFMLLGIVSMGLTYAYADDELHTRFWSNLLHNSVFFTGISFIALFAMCAFITAYAGWFSVFKRIWEAYSLFLIFGIALMGIVALGVYFGWHNLYHWADPASLDMNSDHYDKIIAGKSKFLNAGWYCMATFGFLGLFYFIALRIRSLSVDEDKSDILDFSHHKKIRIWCAALLPFFGFLGPALIWQWVMSVDAHWYSTLFAWYCFASFFVSMIAITILLLIYLKSKGYYPEVNKDHFHDLGKYMFAFSIFWTYCWFSQYMLIWYSNNGEETIYYRERLDSYKILFIANLVINFLLPFFVLMRNDTKRKYGTLGLTAIVLVFSHWLDFFLMIKPGVLHTAHELIARGANHGGGDHGHAVEHAAHFVSGYTLPGFLEIGWFLGFLALFLFIVLKGLARVPLVARRDPYVGESLHHHV